MDGWEALDAGQEELALHEQSPRRARALLGLAAVVLVAVSVLVGWRLGRSSRDAATAATTPAPVTRGIKLAVGPVQLAVGPFQANMPSTYEGPEFVVSIFNVGDHEVQVAKVAPGRWRATSLPATIAAGASAEVPVDVSVDCRWTPPPTDEVLVHATSSGRSVVQTLHLPSVPAALTEEYERLCASAVQRTPRRDELVGVWIVDEGNFFAGQMLIALNANGTFAMDPGTALFDAPGAHGVFTYRAGNLTLATRGGRDCAPGDRSLWRVGLGSDGRLRMEVVSFYDSVCTVETGEVWIARRVSAPTR